MDRDDDGWHVPAGSRRSGAEAVTTSTASDPAAPLVELRNVSVAFGGVKAVDHVSVDLRRGEVVGLLGHNGAGKSTLVKCLSGAIRADAGEILIDGRRVEIRNPRDARALNVETIYQTLALADNLDAVANLFLGRELVTPLGFADDAAMEAEARRIMARLNPNFARFDVPVSALSGGQRQSVAIARAVYFDARILIMDEPTAALGPHETQMVTALIEELRRQGLGIFLIEHDVRNVIRLCDRAMVMKNGRAVGTVRVADVTEEDLLTMIIMGQTPPQAARRPRPAEKTF
jgi:D-xylose transport system ATP-binding protein